MLSPSSLRRLACAFFCLASSFAWSQSQPVFPVLHYEPYAVASPLAMAEGDLNGDSITDTLYAAASVTPGSSTLTSAPRDTSGAALPSIAAGTVSCTANSLLLADLNKDNHLDAIVTCSEDKVAVLAGNGDGTFQSALIFSVTKAAKAIVADLNGDGSPDIVVATNTGTADSIFAILLNTTGSGTLAFAAPHVYSGADVDAPWASGSSKLSISDINSDGKPDIIFGGDPDQFSGAAAAVFFGNGDGTFHYDQNQTGFYLGNSFALADFDGDGKTDIARIQTNGSSVFTLLVIDSRATKTTPTNLQILPGLVRVQAIDVNGDGHLDVVLTGDVTTVLLNDGAAHLSPDGSYATPGAFYAARKGAAGTDLVFSTPRGLYTMHGDAQGKFDGLPAYPGSDQIATADFNNDGVTDVFGAASLSFVGQNDANVTRSLFSRGDGSFLEYPTSSQFSKSFPVAGDFNGDGLVDRVDIYPSVANVYPDPYGFQARIAGYKGNGTGTFTRTGPDVLLGVNLATGAVAGDFDGDGNLDIAVTYFDSSVGHSTGGMLLLRGSGDGTFVPPSAPFYSTADSTHATPFAVDLDNDGDLDLIWQKAAFLNNGAAVFTPAPFSAAGTVLAVGNLNGDNFPDIVIGNTIYAGNGDGTFQPAPFATIATPAGATLISASIGDLDGDGHLDLILQHMTDLAGFTVAYGDGAGNFTVDPNTYTTGSKTPVLGTLVRLNNQATTRTDRMDYLVAADNAVLSLINQRNPPPGPPLKIPTQTVLTSDVSHVVPLQSILLTARLTGISPTGTITFALSDGTVIGKLQPFQQLSYSPPGEGNYTITASYSGDDVNQPSVSAPLIISVAKIATAISFLTDPADKFYTGYKSVLGLNVSNIYSPTGQITLSTNGQTLSTIPAVGGTPTFTYKFPAPGNYTLTASYPGDAANLPASATRSITVVDGPDFTLTASPATATIKAGETATYTLTLTSVRNLAETINFSCRPACATYSLYLGAGQTTTAQFTVHTNPAGTGGTAAPSLIYGPVAAALLLFGVTGLRKKRRHHWQSFGLFAIMLAAGLFSLSGCSSGSSDSSGPAGASGQGTPYYFAISAEGQSSGLEHAVNLTVMVK